MKEIALTREELLALIDDLGGHGFTPDDADSDMLTMIVKNRLLLVTDVVKIDRILTGPKPLPMTWHAQLLTRKLELERAAQAVRDAASGRQPRRGALDVVVPERVGLTHHYSIDGHVARTRTEGGRTVISLTPEEFKSLLANKQFGVDWSDANPDALHRLGEMAR